MKALIKTAAEPGAMEIVDWPEPDVKPGWAVVAVHRGGLCSTDVMIHDWTYRGRHPIIPPAMIGHEATGVVARVGEGVEDVQPGDRVGFQVIWGHPHAPQTLQGFENLDPQWFHLGASALGGTFATYAHVPADRLLRLPDDVDAEDAVLLEPIAVAAHAVELLRIAPGESAAIVGPGPFGLLMCQIASAGGAAPVIAIGRAGVDERRLELARDNGATHVLAFDGDQTASAAAVREITGSDGADAVVDGGGTPESTPLALEIAGSAARVAMFGFGKEATIEPLRQVIRKGLSIHGVSVAQRRHYGAALRMLAAGAVVPSKIVTHRMPITRFSEAVDLMRSKEATKVLFDMAPLH